MRKKIEKRGVAVLIRCRRSIFMYWAINGKCAEGEKCLHFCSYKNPLRSVVVLGNG